MGEKTLYMVRLGLVTEQLYIMARRLRLPSRETDLGYLVHCQLRSLFDEAAPGPFAIAGHSGRHTSVLAQQGG